MRHLGYLIKDHIEAKKLHKAHVAEQVGITPTYLCKLFNRPTMDCALYDKICTVIGLNPSVGFESSESSYQYISDISASTLVGPATVSIGETLALRELLAEKERLIRVLLAASPRLNVTETEQNSANSD